jgi:hypothetical protein
MRSNRFFSRNALVKFAAVVVGVQATVWISQVGSPAASQAQAALPPGADPAAQRQEIVEQLKSLNSKLDKIASLLESGKMQVVNEPTK